MTGSVRALRDPAPGKSAIVEVEDRGPTERAHRVRYMPTVAGVGPEDRWIIEVLEPVSRAVIEDRWETLMGEDVRGKPTKHRRRLDEILHALVEGLTRRDPGPPEDLVIDGERVYIDSLMDVDGLDKVIREWLIERASRPGVAR